MSDEGHRLTDNILEGLEKDLLDMYKESYKTIKPQLEDVRAIIEGLNEEENPVKRLVLQRRQQRLETLLNDIARDIKEANKTAAKMINNEMLNVFEENINYGYYFMEHEGGYNLNTNLYNKNIIKKLYADNENPFTKISLKNITDKSRVYRDLRRHFSAGIRNGETIQELAKRVQGVVNKNLNHSVRIARTETTRLESMGREESFKQGQQMGLKMKKVWISTTDKRTRTSHILLNGKTIDMDKKFSNGLLYPGEYGGKAHEVINCRCTHVVELQGLEPGATIEKDNTVKDKSYKDWKKEKGILKEEVKKNNIENAKSIEELNKITLNELKETTVKSIDFTGANLEKAKEISKQFVKLVKEYDTEPILELKIEKTLLGKTSTGETVRGSKNPHCIIHLKESDNKKYLTKGKEVKGNNYTIIVDDENYNISTITHEFAHTFGDSSQNFNKDFWKDIKSIRNKYSRAFTKIDKDNIVNKTITTEEAEKLKKEIYISEYASKSIDEFLAEAFAEAKLSSNPSKYSLEVLKIIDKYFKKR